ncbi:Pimeloyl-ACP methyl ester carboxylesterase [Georgenia satyanarayanai]|uniref:Pimeloyl-ACP methyl ester carboxylesterase n=1 Tax=Georgenia satyanarayanai TaxID=860221 RepID=A0A2Y9AT41_9MICO|nr:alpha/beta hydrolase [Georgenia satyanarayanai]PYF96746.1 pimeloyl-ACP methyl ester carboxylesterase [Georgenia satyanarayanai]SSA46488.1 Pimeloyl-ACP methyl ester carboxylesterase [Georgenia satyanarayanai]
MGRRLAIGALLAAVAGGVVAAARPSRPPLPRRTGRSATGMEYLVLGDGPRTLLSIPGGPGSDLPTGVLGRLTERESRPYVDAGYAVWTVTRPRDMPVGHTVADMGDDYARFVREEMGGAVDVVLGQSYGGMVALHLAAAHPDVVGAVVLAGAAAVVEEWGTEVDARWARLRAEGRDAEAGAVFLEYLLPDPRYAPLRRRLGGVAGRLAAGSTTPPGDLLVEADAELAFDAREVLGSITAPVLLLAGEEDRFFSLDTVRSTAARIRRSTLVTYPGRGHVATISSSDVPRDVLAWLERLGPGTRDGRHPEG